jgi:cyclic pyranopterin phosphate synthase
LKGCLFTGEGTDLKPFLRTADNGELREALRLIVTGKPGRHHLIDEEHASFAMSQVGG